MEVGKFAAVAEAVFVYAAPGAGEERAGDVVQYGAAAKAGFDVGRFPVLCGHAHARGHALVLRLFGVDDQGAAAVAAGGAVYARGDFGVEAVDGGIDVLALEEVAEGAVFSVLFDRGALDLREVELNHPLPPFPPQTNAPYCGTAR